MSLLESINGPEDIKELAADQLQELADEVRQRLIDVVSETGGHIGSGLGVVELTVALLRCFDSPRDKIVWDVGHQGYPWKVLTGRNDRLPTLRQEGGLSGFLRPDESEHDIFAAGHAGTAMSAALGIAARDVITLPQIEAMTPNGKEMEDFVLLTLFKSTMPAAGYALLLVVLISIIMSSLDSLLNAGAVAFTQDIVKPHMDLQDHAALSVGRSATVVIALTAAAGAVAVDLPEPIVLWTETGERATA